MDYLARDYTLRLEPQLPYVYLPPNLYETFAEKVNALTKDKYDTPVCNLLDKACVYPMSCDKITDTSIYLTFKIKDGKGNYYTFGLNSRNLKLPGEELKHPGNYCYMPVFSHGLTGTEDSQTIIMGNIILERYYLVYDMSPLEKD